MLIGPLLYKGVYISRRNFAKHWVHFLGSQMSPLSIHAIFIKPLSLLSVRYFCFCSIPQFMNKLVTCSNGEQWCPLVASTGSIGKILYWGDLIIFKWYALLESSNITLRISSLTVIRLYMHLEKWFQSYGSDTRHNWKCAPGINSGAATGFNIFKWYRR